MPLFARPHVWSMSILSLRPWPPQSTCPVHSINLGRSDIVEIGNKSSDSHKKQSRKQMSIKLLNPQYCRRQPAIIFLAMTENRYPSVA